MRHPGLLWWWLLLLVAVPPGSAWAQEPLVEPQDGLYALLMDTPGVFLTPGLPGWPVFWAPAGVLSHWKRAFPESFLLQDALTERVMWEWVPGEWLQEPKRGSGGVNEPLTEIRYGVGRQRWQYVSVRYAMSRPLRLWKRNGMLDVNFAYRGHTAADPYGAPRMVGKQWQGGFTYREGARYLRVENWNALLRGGVRGRVLEAATGVRLLQPDAWKRQRVNVFRLMLADTLAGWHVEAYQRNDDMRYEPDRNQMWEMRTVERGGRVETGRAWGRFRVHVSAHLQSWRIEGLLDTLRVDRRRWGGTLRLLQYPGEMVLRMEREAGFWLPAAKITYKRRLGWGWYLKALLQYSTRLPSLLARKGWPGVFKKLDEIRTSSLFFATLSLQRNSPSFSWKLQAFAHESRREEVWRVYPASPGSEVDSFWVAPVSRMQWGGIGLQMKGGKERQGVFSQHQILVLWPLQIAPQLRQAWPRLSGVFEVGYRHAFFQRDLLVEGIVRGRYWTAFKGWFLNQAWGTYALPQNPGTYVSSGGWVDVIVQAHLRTAVLRLTIENVAGRWSSLKRAPVPGYPLPEAWVRVGIFWPLKG